MTIEIWLAYQSNFELFFGCTFLNFYMKNLLSLQQYLIIM